MLPYLNVLYRWIDRGQGSVALNVIKLKEACSSNGMGCCYCAVKAAGLAPARKKP